jgi:hypothetical protein
MVIAASLDIYVFNLCAVATLLVILVKVRAEKVANEAFLED